MEDARLFDSLLSYPCYRTGMVSMLVRSFLHLDVDNLIFAILIPFVSLILVS